MCYNMSSFSVSGTKDLVKLLYIKNGIQITLFCTNM